MLKLASWNVNSVKARLPVVTKWLEQESPDVVCLQELKSMTETVPVEEFEKLGYHCIIKGQKSYNGVALLSKHPVKDVITELPGDATDEQARYVQATIDVGGSGTEITVASIYLPNGNPVDTEKYPYKLSWMDRLIAHTKELMAKDTPFALLGDYNIIPQEEDCWDANVWRNDALFKLESRKKFRELLNVGLTEAYRTLHPNSNEDWTFWDYQAGRFPKNEGIRIDHILLSPEAANLLHRCWIDKEPRTWERPSDHTPILANLSM